MGRGQLSVGGFCLLFFVVGIVQHAQSFLQPLLPFFSEPEGEEGGMRLAADASPHRQVHGCLSRFTPLRPTAAEAGPGTSQEPRAQVSSVGDSDSTTYKFAGSWSSEQGQQSDSGVQTWNGGVPSDGAKCPLAVF